MNKKENFKNVIYCIENILDNKKYIGQAANYRIRIGVHLNQLKQGIDASEALQRAWAKYGGENFNIYMVEECEESDLDEREEYYIKEWHTHVSEWGYNIAWGGSCSMRGRNHSEKTKQKMSVNQMGENNSMFGKKHSEETLKKMSESHKNMTMQTKEKISKSVGRGENNVNFGRHHTEESRKNMSEAHIGNKQSEETKEKISKNSAKPMLGKHHSDETKNKISESLGSGENNVNFGKHYSEERCKNISESLKGNTNVLYKKQKSSSSKYIGVYFFKDSNKWCSRFWNNGKYISLGLFSTELEAGLAFNECSLEYLGWKAVLNNISEEEIKTLWEMDI